MSQIYQASVKTFFQSRPVLHQGGESSSVPLLVSLLPPFPICVACNKAWAHGLVFFLRFPWLDTSLLLEGKLAQILSVCILHLQTGVLTLVLGAFWLLLQGQASGSLYWRQDIVLLRMMSIGPPGGLRLLAQRHI